MSLVSVPIYNTAENRRDSLVRNCLQSLAKTVNWNSHHKLYLIDDASTCDKVMDLYRDARSWLPFTLIQNSSGLGTARSVNRAWLNREPYQCAVKMDSDLTFSDPNWLDKLEEAIGKDRKLGILSLKRRDLAEHPYWPDLEDGKPHPYKSELISLPHEPGQRWHVVEKVGHCIGSCQMYSPLLLNKIGYLAQWGRYSLDDSLAAVRCAVAGFYSAFYCNVDLSHDDPGDTPYQAWKQDFAGSKMGKFSKLCEAYMAGERDVYCGPDVDLDTETI